MPPRHSANSPEPARTPDSATSTQPARSARGAHAAFAANDSVLSDDVMKGLRKPVPRSRIIGIIVLAIVAIVAAVAISNCTRADTGTTTQPTYVSPYNWSNLNTKSPLYTYSSGGALQSKSGIDVSDHQGAIDWDAVAGDGVRFAYIRLGYRGTTEGGMFGDEYFEQNLAGAKAAGLETGVYFYSQATTEAEAIEEADYVLMGLGGVYLDYPVAYDAEPTTGTSRISNLSKDQLTKNAIAFCTEIERGGYSAIVYGNNKDMSRYDRTQLTAWPVWYAEYGSLPSAQFDFTMWQYSNAGSISGISTSIDLDIDLTDAYAAAKKADQ